ncbi:MAG TPA: hypothetical protein VGH87_17245 [Polyangiaceae bacterium]
MIAILAAAVVAASASASASASVAPTASATAMPMNHPHVEQKAAQNFFRPPPDTSDEDPKLAPGTIVVELRDALNNVLPNTTVLLGIIHQSVAKGDSREHLQQNTAGDGTTTFAQLESSAGTAFRVSVKSEDASFAARPFTMPHDHGMHVVLHVYPVIHELPQTLQIGSRAIVYVEVKEDRIQVQERVDLFNGTPAAFVPHDLILRLPENFTALNAQQQMSDIGVDAVPHEGARVHGTFVPGENTVVFSWQLPYSSEPSLDMEIGLPPAARQVVVRAAAAPGMRLEVPTFREAAAQVSEEGQRELVTGRQLNDTEAPLRKFTIKLSDLPTPGPTRLVGTALAAAGIVAGIWVTTQSRFLARKRNTKAGVKRDRERILQEVEDLERAHVRGDIGPKTYERARRELVDELAAVLAAAR